MRRSRYVCDCCGKDIDEMADYTEIDFGDVYCYDIGEVDLCVKCLTALGKHIEKFIEGGKDVKEEDSIN